MGRSAFGPWGELVRGSYTPRGGGYGVISEALTGWWLTARAEPRLADLREPIAERAICIAGLAVEAQIGRRGRRGRSPAGARGGRLVPRRGDPDGRPAARAGRRCCEPSRSSRRRERAIPATTAPSGWLWAVVLVLALNPARAAFGVPRAGAVAADAVGVAAAGGAIGGARRVRGRGAGDPLLEALDVSEPSFRIAAGIVAALAGVGDLFRRPPRARARTAGRRAALVPVAIPVVARPGPARAGARRGRRRASS